MGWTFQRHKEQLGHELQLKANGNEVSNLQFCSQEFSCGFSNTIAIDFKESQISGCQGPEGTVFRVQLPGSASVGGHGSNLWWPWRALSGARRRPLSAFDPARAITMQLCRSVPEGYTTITFKRSKDRPCGGSLKQSTRPLRTSSQITAEPHLCVLHLGHEPACGLQENPTGDVGSFAFVSAQWHFKKGPIYCSE